MKGIFLLLGTNMGDRLTNLQLAKDHLSSFGINIVDYSSIYESAPWGDENQNWFLNMVLRVDTVYEPMELLDACLTSEQRMGRTRIKKWGERIIDIDILYYDNIATISENLTLPHPGIPMRNFTLQPMVEIAPNEKHPLLKSTQHELLEMCPDTLACFKTELEITI